MRTLILFIILIIATVSINAQDAIKRLIVETYYISDVNDATDTVGGKLDIGSKTYRVFIQMKPGYKLKSIFGDKDHALIIRSTANFFNNLDRGKTFGKEIDGRFLSRNTTALDTWLTIGQATKNSTKTYFGVLKTQDLDGSILGTNDGGSAVIAGGLLKNNNSQAGIPLFTEDGLVDSKNVPTDWFDNGFKDMLTGVDSTIFGSVKPGSEFVSNNAFLSNSGVAGLNPDSNQVLIAQLTTAGNLYLELNVQLTDSIGNIFYYVAKGKDSSNLSVSPFLKFPADPPKCGCNDPNFLEFNNSYTCLNMDSCKRRIIFGCMDPAACNYNPNSNFNLQATCCYPGSCADRDISLVCPTLGSNKIAVNIFPNPANDKIELELLNINTEKVFVSIYDLYGKKFNEYKISTSNEKTVMNVSSLSKGMYLLRVQNTDGISITKYLIKN